MGERCRPPGPGCELVLELRKELLVREAAPCSGLKALERGDQRLRNVASAKRPEAAALVRVPVSQGVVERKRPGRGKRCAHIESPLSVRAALTKRPISSGDLIPGWISTPRDTSTPNGCTAFTISATL